jgi:hypothetical protein
MAASGTPCGPMAPRPSGDPGRLAGAPGPSPSPSSRRFAWWARVLTLASAALIVAGGYVHFCLYANHGYRSIPKIGPSFLLQFTSSAAIAVALVFARGSLRAGHRRVAVAQLARLAGIGLGVGTLAALAIAHTSGGLFGFREIGLKPAPQTLIAILVEYDAAVLLAIAMLLSRLAARRAPVASREHHPGGTRLPDAA